MADDTCRLCGGPHEKLAEGQAEPLDYCWWINGDLTGYCAVHELIWIAEAPRRTPAPSDDPDRNES